MAERVYQQQLSAMLTLLGVDGGDYKQTLITGLALDSRQVVAGDVFIAYQGSQADGRDYLVAAQQAGAVAILYEAEQAPPINSEINIPCFAVNGLSAQVGYLAHEFYQAPSEQCQVFGVTGTNGKTTCAFLLAQMLQNIMRSSSDSSNDAKVAFIGTIGVGLIDDLLTHRHSSPKNTTPDPIALHKTLGEFRDQGVTQVCMEVSSHALDQGRVNGVRFFCTQFTNLSQDHLDYHHTMQEYAAAKQRLFSEHRSELAVINADDVLGAQLLDIGETDFAVSYGDAGDVRAEQVTLNEQGIELEIHTDELDFIVQTPLIGALNVPNLLLLSATLLALSVEVADIQQGFKQLQPASGRMQLLGAKHQASVVIDYAHTPDALEQALLSVREHCDEVLWCVFGCGGDRDQSKRPLMGAAAQKGADRVVITNDNPRSEAGEVIAEQVLAGMQGAVDVELDRARAIAQTIQRATANDWVLIAGKGHETSQNINGVLHPFSDYQQAREALERKGLEHEMLEKVQ